MTPGQGGGRSCPGPGLVIGGAADDLQLVDEARHLLTPQVEHSVVRVLAVQADAG